MRTIAFPLLTVAALLFADTALAQRGGRGRPEEITNRVACFFVDVAPPVGEGAMATELANTDLIRAAAGANQVAVLYLFDGGDAANMREQFEKTMFGNDTIGLHLRFFHCGRIDVAKAPALKSKYGKDLPLFVTFNKEGKQADDAAMPGYKASGNALVKALEKAGNPVYKPSLAAAVKNYSELVRDLEQMIARRKLLEDRQSRTTGDDASAKQKRAAIDKDLKDLDAEKAKLEQKETELIQKLHMPVRDSKAVQLGGGGGRGGRGPGGGGPGGGG